MKGWRRRNCAAAACLSPPLCAVNIEEGERKRGRVCASVSEGWRGRAGGREEGKEGRGRRKGWEGGRMREGGRIRVYGLGSRE